MKSAFWLWLPAVCLLTAAAWAQEPLKMEGKSTLYQRVLTTPSCELRASPQNSVGRRVPAFSRYYVYGRDQQRGLLQVGPDSTGTIAGFLDERCTVPWKMQTALFFTNPANRDRTMIFAEEQDLENLVQAADPQPLVRELQYTLETQGRAPGVVAQEPATWIDYTQNFYLLPILSSQEDLFYSDDLPVRMLEIASVTDRSPQSGPAAIGAFKAAMVFVIDSSISMQPYIDKTKEIIHEVYQTIAAEGLQDSVQFGLVSFRSDTRATPGLEYTSRIFVRPGEVSSGEAFEQKVAELKQASVSSVLFDEDAYSGVLSALEAVDWNRYGGRYIILITDAGAIEGASQYSSTRLDAVQLRQEAEYFNTAIYAMHLLTPAGRKNHDKARAQYEDLTFNQTVQKSLYYPVDAGNVQSFGNNISLIARTITEQVKLASLGMDAAGSAAGAASGLEQDLALVGQAMRLRYLGTQSGQRAPEIFRGFMADRDLIRHHQPTATPVVLLTKAQLSDLYDVCSALLEQAGIGMLAPSEMFSNLLSLAAAMNNDAGLVAQQSTLSIAQMGLLGEYLDDLPYRSAIAGLTEEDWIMMSPEEQNNLIRDLESKLEYYRRCIEDADRWLQLAPEAADQEAVYPIPLESLP